jgi:RNA polymerase sigma-70 factor (ECF subfamily)
MTTETTLIRQAAAGDRDAFSALVEAHWTPLVRLARSVIGEGDAEDAVQDALVLAWGKLSTLRDESAFPAWLKSIVMRRCLRHRRRLLPWLPLSAAPEPIVNSGAEAGLDVARLLSRLAPRQRAVMHLTAVEGMTDREIATILKITAAAVRSHRRRARESLNLLMEGQKIDEPQAQRAF